MPRLICIQTGLHLLIGIAVIGMFSGPQLHAQEKISESRAIRIVKPRVLPAGEIPAVRTPLGIPNDYKPWIAQLKSGELLIVAFCFGGEPSNKLPAGAPYLERAVFWRSNDGGRTWGAREERSEIHGREFSLTALADGTLIMPCHFLANDAANKAGYTYSKVFR
ncbi:MAG: exo-alpha-sialidase [Planctomycetia bacterium]|nr:exo-alpha-sialidase [Planctomycetia bacterium]